MVPFRTRIAALEAAGYANGPAQAKLAGRKANWLEISPDEAMSGILAFLETLCPRPRPP